MTVGNYVFKFVHYNDIVDANGNPMQLVVPGAVEPVAGLTICSVYDATDDTFLASGIAYRIVSDQNNRVVGRDLAFKRALHELVKLDQLTVKHKNRLVEKYLVAHPTSLRRAAGIN